MLSVMMMRSALTWCLLATLPLPLGSMCLHDDDGALDAGISLLQIAKQTHSVKVAVADVNALPLVPKPQKFSTGSGGSSSLKSLLVKVAEADDEMANLVQSAQKLFAATSSIPLEVADSQDTGSADRLPVELVQVASFQGDALEGDGTTEAERYRLEASPKGVRIEASTPHGLFHGLITLRQLIRKDSSNKDMWVMPAASVDDKPVLQWRGLMLDVARHFFTADEVKQLLTVMSLFKLNKFHWHLGDDQGWRFPVKSWPELIRVGQWRSGTPHTPRDNDMHRHDSVLYGGAYTESDIRDVVSFANSLFIEVVPEVDVPGHVQAAVAAYPELGNTDIPNWQEPDVAHFFGAFDFTLAPNGKSFKFLEDVINEVSDLIPSDYMHLGGDEVSSSQWSMSPKARHFAKDHDIPSTNMGKIQGFFQRLSIQHATKHGRRPIVWDEASRPDWQLPNEAIVMLWRVFRESDMHNVEDLTRRGFDVVLAPHMFTYLDRPESEASPYAAPVGTLPLSRVYSLPLPKGEGTGRVLGGQAQLWTEYINGGKAHLDFMAWPRGCALAERLWAGAAASDFDDFKHRLEPLLSELHHMGVGFTPQDYE